jgi:hypothetical protein
MICTEQGILLGRSADGGYDGRDMWHVWGRRETRTGFWGETRRGENAKELGIDGRILLKWTLWKYGNAWIEFIWLSIGTDRGLLHEKREFSDFLKN